MSKNGKDGKNGQPEETERKLTTTPFDPRFPNDDQTLACFVYYTDYYRCKDLLEGDERCELLRTFWETICPNEWVARWDEKREAGNFPNRIIRVPKDYCEQQANKRKEKKN